MQSLDVISINLWQILISLCNLLILYLILKRFLYKPVQRAMAQRKAALEAQYAAAEEAERAAGETRRQWEDKMAAAQSEADQLLQTAQARAQRRGSQIEAEAKERAESMVRQAQAQAELEQKKAEAGIRHEIVDVSALLAGKLLRREIKPEDHRKLIDSVISEIGESDG